MPSSRQLFAILFTDIEGYSALVQQDEQMGLAIRNRHSEIVQKEHKQFNGRVIHYYGDWYIKHFSKCY